MNHTIWRVHWCACTANGIMFRWEFQSLVFLFVYFRLPFDWKTPFGYFIALFLEIPALYTMLFNALTLLCLFFGSSWIFIQFAEDITNDLKQLKRNKETDRNDRILKKHFFSAVQFYSDAKQLSPNFKLNWIDGNFDRIFAKAYVFFTDYWTNLIESMKLW